MKWIGKHPVFSDLLIGGVLLTPPDPQYEYELTLPNDDGAAGQVLSTDGSGVLSWVANGVAVPNALTAGTGVDYASGTTWDGSAANTINLDLTEVIATDGANRVLTSDGDGTLSAEATLTFQPSLGGLYVAGGAGATSGLIINADTTSNAFSSEFRFWNTRGGNQGQDNDVLGTMSFVGNNDDLAPATKHYNKIIGSIADSATGSEKGKLDFQVMEYDGTLTSGLSLTGMDANGEIDVTIGAGAASTTAIAGELTLGADLAIAHGGTGASTAQAAIDALTAVSGASAGQRLTKDGSGNATWANATTGTTLNGTTAGGVATYASANTLDIEPDFTWDGSDLHVSSSISQKPQLILENTNTDNKPPNIKFLKDKGAAGADLDYVGTINWYGDNSAQTETQFGQIRTRIVTALATDEASSMEIKVAGSNGTTSQMRNMITGTGHGTNDTVNVNLGYGAASATTIAGTLTMGSTAAMTNAGLLSVGNQSNITGLGTISSGVWEGTAIGVAHGGTGLTTVGANQLVTGNGAGALTSESNCTFGATSNTFRAGFAGAKWEFGSIYGSGGFPSVLTANIGANAVIDGYSLFGTAVASMIKFNSPGSMDAGDCYIEAAHAQGTDKMGADLILVGGSSTGSDPGGRLMFYGGASGGGSGTTQRIPTLKFTVDGDGNTSMSGDLTVTGGDITIGSTAGELVSTGQHIHKQTKVTIDQAGCNALNSSPQTLVAAQGANTIIIPVEVTCLVDRNSADTSLGDLIVGWNNTTTFTYALKYSRRWMYGITTDMTFVLGGYAGKGAASLTGGENVPLTIATSTGMTNNSLTSMTVYTSYYVIDNS